MTILDETERAIRSARSTGAVGKNAIVPRIIPHLAKKTKTILDFGCGKDMIHVKALREKGYSVEGFDFSIPNSYIDYVRDKKYDVVYLSNVLNVQPSEQMLSELITTITLCLKPKSIVVANYPYKPRYLGWDTNEMLEWLIGKFKMVARLDEKLAGKNIIWVMMQ